MELKHTNDELICTKHNAVIYCIYVRSHSKEGTFSQVTKDLARIASLGVDYIWLMPIHPIGQLKKKGSLGCPYSISDYRSVNPEYGTMEDFKELISVAHKLNLKVMIDVVFNHTAHDSVLMKEHPEWYKRNEKGDATQEVENWSDIIDLRYEGNPGLWEYLIESLKQWVNLGVSGFRCDVAGMIPMDFWRQARSQISKINPDVFWLAETWKIRGVATAREKGIPFPSDSEMYECFDLTYDYDVWPAWRAVLAGKLEVKRYLELLQLQNGIYPPNFAKMRFVENHDVSRVMDSTSRDSAIAWTAFAAFNKGTFLIYGGQESEAKKRPSLFEKQQIEWNDFPLQNFITKIAKLKKDKRTRGIHRIIHHAPVMAVWQGGLGGIFSDAERQGCGIVGNL